jgi:ATP-dependent 26S proteasome regulatory subunit
MSNFRDTLRQKNQAEKDEQRRREAEEAKRRRENEELRRKMQEDAQQQERQRAQQRQEIFQTLDSMVTEVLKILGDETWGRGSLFSTPYKIGRFTPNTWVLYHFIGKDLYPQYAPPHHTLAGYGYEHDKFEGYIIELVFSNDIKPLHFTINDNSFEKCAVSREGLEQKLLQTKPITWRAKKGTYFPKD